MSEFLSDGGVGMVPVLIFGFLAVATAALYLLRPRRGQGGLILALGATTAAAGLLGFFTGVLGVFRYVPSAPADEQLLVVTQGVAESLHNVVLAFILVVLTGLLASIGAFWCSACGVAAAALLFASVTVHTLANGPGFPPRSLAVATAR